MRALNRQHAGFTLNELLIAVVIVGILAGVALPQYRKTVERSYWRAAQDILETLYAGEQVYQAANDVYADPADPVACPPPENWRCIYMDNPNIASRIPVTFSLAMNNAVVPPTFTATATRNGGPCDGLIQTVDQARTFGGDWPADGVCP